MTDEASRPCGECQGKMSPIVMIDKRTWEAAGVVRGFMCAECGRIALYGGKADA